MQLTSSTKMQSTKNRINMSSYVTPTMVHHLAIYESCNQKIPCVHLCKITLHDGRTGSRHFNYYEIHALLKEIPKNNVSANSCHATCINPQNFISLNQFNIHENLAIQANAVHFLITYNLKNIIDPIPTELLSKVFTDSLR